MSNNCLAPGNCASVWVAIQPAPSPKTDTTLGSRIPRRPAQRQPGVRGRQPPRVPLRRRRRLAALPFGEDAQPQFAPALPGVDHGAVGLELDVAAGLSEAGPDRWVGVQPL